MDIQTISSLAGLRAVPATVRTYGDALNFLDTLAAAHDASVQKLRVANEARQITSALFNSIYDDEARVAALLGSLQDSFGAKSHGATLSAPDALALSNLDVAITAFAMRVDHSVSGSAKWVWIGLGAVATAGVVAWFAGWLPSYGRKSRRRRR